jgi:nicotinamide phosphoribosyltransferase
MVMLSDNILLMTDSYKASHFKQYPAGTSHVYSYLESRGGDFSKTTFFGLQYVIKRYLTGQVVTQEKIDEAEKFFTQHMGSGLFNREGWEYILKAHGGKLPIKIRAVPEGTVLNTKNVLVTVENTDPKCYWLTNYLETLLLHVWYPTTVATLSYHFKELIGEYLEKTGDPTGISFKLHDFGFRGVSSYESAATGGAAHLVNFMGTDTLAGITLLQNFYGATAMPAFSIPASEHSTITSWGREGELAAMENMLDQYPTGLVACVSDSFDIFKACSEYWGTALKEKVLKRNGTLVIRPDSGDPVEVVVKCLNILGEKFGFDVNDKGYKVLPPQVRMIQGDGIDLAECRRILEAMRLARWSADNIAFGCGGALLQKMNRDTQKFAFKCSSVTVNGEERDVYKQPITAEFKVSKKGRMKLVLERGWKDGDINNVRYVTVGLEDPRENLLKVVFENGELLEEQDLTQIRDRASHAIIR